MKTTNRPKILKNKKRSLFFELEKEVFSHPAWKGRVSLTEVAHLLDGHVPFTYALSVGFDRHHYILSFVSESGAIKHKNIRILLAHGKPYFLNGGSGGPCGKIDDLIPKCLKVSNHVVQPLQ